MRDIIPTYSCVVAKEIDNNFYKNKIYIMFYSTYESRKNIIDEAEAIIVWPHVNELKYINPNYIWKIKSKWKYTAIFDKENNTFEVKNIECSNKYWDFSSRLLNVHTIQQKYFNEKLDYLDYETDWYYIEIEEINSYDRTNAYYKEKELFYLNEYFNEQGELINKEEGFRYFKFWIDKNLLYDAKRELFYWDWLWEIWFTSRTHRTNLNKFLKLLIRANGAILHNEYIFKTLELVNKDNEKFWTEKVNDLKKEMKRFFTTHLEMREDLFDNEILIAPRSKWYRINWDILSNQEHNQLV